MAELTKEQATIRLNYIAAMLEPDDMVWFEPLRDMALRAFAELRATTMTDRDELVRLVLDQRSDYPPPGNWNEACLHIAKVVASALSSQQPVASAERIAQLIAHRACGNQEQDPQNGKLAGYCVVCQIPWPCAYASPQPRPTEEELLAAHVVEDTHKGTGQWPRERILSRAVIRMAGK